MSPDGEYIPCSSWEHDEKARVLSQQHYQSFEGTVCLEMNGWVRILLSGRLLYTEKPTYKQAQALEMLLSDIDPLQGPWFISAVGDVLMELMDNDNFGLREDQD